jgi:hypothetical protein
MVGWLLSPGRPIPGRLGRHVPRRPGWSWGWLPAERCAAMFAEHLTASALPAATAAMDDSDWRRFGRAASHQVRFILGPFGPRGLARRAGRPLRRRRRRCHWLLEDGTTADAEPVILGAERPALGALGLVDRLGDHRRLWRQRGRPPIRHLKPAFLGRCPENNRRRGGAGASARCRIVGHPGDLVPRCSGGERNLRHARRGRRWDCSRLVRHQPMATVAAEGQLAVVVRAADVTRCHGLRGPSRGG